MLNQYYYHGLIRKYIAIFGTLFNNIKIKRLNSSNDVVETIAIPLAYAPRQKFLTRITGDPNLDKKVGMQLPRMGFELQSMTYDAPRKLASIGSVAKNVDNSIGRLYNPVPYNFNLSLFIFCKNAEDGTQIIEQILPFFKPEFTVTLNAIPIMGIKYDVPIILNSVNVEDNYEGNFEQRRSLIWTLNFDLKGALYPGIQGKGFGTEGSIGEVELKLIRKTFTDFYIVHDPSIVPEKDFVLLESSTRINPDYIKTEDHSLLLAETGSTDFENTEFVVSSVTSTPDDPLALNAEESDITRVVDFYAAGAHHNLYTGNYVE